MLSLSYLLGVAQANDKQAWGIIGPSLWLAGALLVGAGIVWLYQAWQRREDFEDCDASDQLAQFRELYDNGEMDETEFKRVHALLSVRIQREMEVERKESLPVEPTQSSEQLNQNQS